ncbi:MAG: DUF3100 domain-containing protein [Pseudomonadota bacterium]
MNDWRLAAALAFCVLVGAKIGIVSVPIGSFKITLLPLVFAFFVGIVINPNVTGFTKRLIRPESSTRAASFLATAVMPLIALLSAYIGPQFQEVAALGPALVLQEFGNIGTMIVAMPLAVVGFKMGREAIGATFSIGREGGLAFIFGKYGGGGPEATGVMGVYICGTIFGVIFFSFAPSFIAGLELFDPRALAMACGTGSASMTGACSTTVAAIYPAQEEEIVALAATSNLMTGLTGLFITIFITLPLAEWYFKRLRLRVAKPGQEHE